ncbi:MAG: hypothetical protein LBH01_01290 [Verrucomicrobiales bacterium]|jgi:hypothetical protein|nr:hypothetical protein [Verrucomicrobiales bacterium]
MNIFRIILPLILLFCGCSKSNYETLKLQRIEIFFRAKPVEGSAADLYLYRLTCEDRTLVCCHWSGFETPDEEVKRFGESVLKWQHLSTAQGTKPVVMLYVTDFIHKYEKAYGGETHLIFYPNARNLVSPASIDFSWEKFPSGGLFAKFEPTVTISDKDQCIASFSFDCELLLKKNILRDFKDAATGP